MTLQAIPGGLALTGATASMQSGGTSSILLNAANEFTTVVGRAMLIAGSGSKTISAAGGGVILWKLAAATWANASSNLRVGVGDVDLSSGLPDFTFDVYADLVPGTDALAAGLVATAMDTGTKTIAHGDLIAILVRLTARSGADTLTVVGCAGADATGSSGYAFPYGYVNTGIPAKTQNVLVALIQFDDGSLGWIQGNAALMPNPATVSYHLDSTPDEYCAVFTPQFTMEIDGFAPGLAAIATGDDFEIVLYENPSTSPSIIEALTPDPDVLGTQVPGAVSIFPCTPVVLNAGTEYGISLRPTTTNAVEFIYYDLTTTFELLKATQLFGTTALVMARTGNSGAFSTVQTYYVPKFFLNVSKLDDGTGGGFAVVTSSEPVILSAIPVGY